MKIKKQRIHNPNKDFNPQTYVAIDTETTGVCVWGERPLLLGKETVQVIDEAFMVSMCDENGNTWCCQWPVDPFTRKVTVDSDDLDFIMDTLLIPEIEVVFHNAKFDYRMLCHADGTDPFSGGEGIKFQLDQIQKQGRLHDTLFMGRVVNTLELSYGLKFLAKKYLGVDNTDEKDLQQAVVSARRQLTAYNRQAAKENRPLMLKNTSMKKNDKNVVKADYWLPTVFDKGNPYCEKYCRLDTFRTMGLFLFYRNIIEKDKYLSETYRLEMQDIWPIVNAMEERGLRIYPDELNLETVRCQIAIEEHGDKMQEIVKEQGLVYKSEEVEENDEMNPRSSKQLLTLLYSSPEKGGLGIPPQFARKGKNAGVSLTADKDTLRELMYVPFVQELVAYRSASQAKSLFFDKIKHLIHKDHISPDCFVSHASFNQCGTKTGRFSGGGEGGFNGQQTSAGGKKSLGGGTYSSQKIFGPRPGYYWLGFDYSQQEARLFAYLAQVPLMLDAMAKGEDIFKAMANKAWGGKDNPSSLRAGIQALDLFRDPANRKVKEYHLKIGWLGKHRRTVKPSDPFVYRIVQEWLAAHDYDLVAAEASLDKEASRQRCKHITYAKIFGGGPGSFTHLLLCSLEEAKVFDRDYNASMPEMKQYMNVLTEQARLDGYIINLYGRKLRVDRSLPYRAVSYMIQGSAASMMKSSLKKIHDFNTSSYVDSHLIATIHDEAKIEIAIKDFSMAYVRAIAHRMEDTEGKVGIHIPVEASLCSQFWGENEEKLEIWKK